jgi:RHS repeat-associated protein
MAGLRLPRWKSAAGWRLGVMLAVAVPLAVGTGPALGSTAGRPAAAPSAAAAGGWGLRPPAPRQRPVRVFAVRPVKAHIPVMHPWRPPAATWPTAGSATAAVPAGVLAGAGRARRAVMPAGPAPGSVRAGGLPLEIGLLPAAGGPAAGTARPGGGARLAVVRASVLPRRLAVTAGVAGMVFTLAAGNRAAAGRRVHVSVDYSSFAYADGGDFASRLRLVELPSCVLTDPGRPGCRVQSPLVSADNVRTDRVGADVRLPSGQTAVAMAVTTSTSGSSGDFTATPLSEAGKWSAGGPSGAFTYSYPISVPPVPGGLKPAVALAYNSQAVDGLTSSTNSQASLIGDGWDYSPGFIERGYQSCEQKPPGATNWVKSGDLCWSSNDTVTLSLNGQSTTLVQDGSTGTWRAEADSNEKIQYLTGTVNGTHDGGYWVVTTPDGTSYYFGRNELPGFASGDATTDSAWTVPVFATSSGQPCFNSTFSSSFCTQAWRWNLDYVTDPHSDAMAYFYQIETNSYSRDNGTTANSSYVQAGALSSIEYGLRAGAVYGVTPAAKVTFTTGQSRTDIPSDLSCTNGSTCEVISPTFWGKFQLTSISTQALEGSSLAPVDSWALSQTYPSTGDPTSPASLWLSGITRTGADTAGGGSSTSLPAMSFAGVAMANRVMTQVDLNSGYSIITRFRLTSVTSETGGVTGVTYDSPGGVCTSGNFPAPDANTALCYPDYWSPSATGPVLDWFNKYVVTAVTQTDTSGGAVAVATSYSYSGAAWHYDDDTLTRSSQRTWDQWRGFHAVTTETGTAPDPVTQVTDTYFQGMNGDYQSNGTTSSASLSARGVTVTDSDQFDGMLFEHTVYDGAGGAQVSDNVTVSYTSAATATQSQPSPLPALRAFITGTAETKTFTPLVSGGTRESDLTYTHDSDGRVTSASDVPDTTDPSQTTCTTVTYAPNTSAYILNLVKENQIVSVPCGTTSSLPADAVSDTLTFYDGATSLSSDTPTTGDVTQTRLATSYSGSTPAYTTETTSTYDEYGRVLTGADADGRKTTTSYTPATGAEPTSITVTDPVGLVTTTAYDPARDLPVQATSPAGYITSKTYDGLGRLTSVWKPGRAKATDPANVKFAYAISATAPSVVTTSTLNDTGAYTVSETLYDSLSRPAETQSATPDGGRVITDNFYNSDSQVSLQSAPYFTTGAPSSTLVAAPDGQVPSQTGFSYDGAGRVSRQIAYKLAAETSEIDTAYQGNATTVTYQNKVSGQPDGGIAHSTLTDGRGLTSQIFQYHAGAAANPAGPASAYDDTSYTYTRAGKLATITDAAGNQWSYFYSLAGDQITATTPDSGTTTSSYDAAGQVMSVTDARGKTISYTYDADGRKTAEYDTTGGAAENSGDQLASWTWDTKAKGLLTSSSTFYGGQAYTQQVIGYNSLGLPTGTQTVIPSAQGALAGTYSTGITYNTDTEAPATVFSSAAGGLPAETVDVGYDTAGHPVSLGSSLYSYVTSLTYTELGQPSQYTLGPSSSQVFLTDTYDQQTQRLTGTQVVTGSNSTAVDTTGYTYDNVGNVLSETDTPASGPAQDQCFQYDYLGRLAAAWSQASTGCAATPSASAEGGAAPYLHQYSYDVAGNLTSQTATQPNGTTVTTTSAFPAPGSAQPHAATSTNVTGAGTTTYGYDPAGNLTSVSGAQNKTLTWDDAGRLATDTVTPSSTTTYLYNSDGTLLLQEDPGTTTLYLTGEQLVLSTASGTVTGTRYYSIGGLTIAARTSAGTLDFLFGDRQGTSTLAVDATTQAVTRRHYDPYGNPLGAPPATWPGDRGFIGGTNDPATGLTNLGVREYNPATSTFLTTDPLLTPYNPQDLNPYAYAAGNPATNSDPTGANSSSNWLITAINALVNVWNAILLAFANGNSVSLFAPVTSPGGSFSAQDLAVLRVLTVAKPILGDISALKGMSSQELSALGKLDATPGIWRSISALHNLPNLAKMPKFDMRYLSAIACLGWAPNQSCPRGGQDLPDYFTLGVSFCLFLCVGASVTLDVYGRAYVSLSGGKGLGVGIGVTPGYILNSDPQYHTAKYVQNFITGPSSSTSGGVGYVSGTLNHGLPGYAKQDFALEPGVGVAPALFDFKIGGSVTDSYTWTLSQALDSVGTVISRLARAGGWP